MLRPDPISFQQALAQAKTKKPLTPAFFVDAVSACLAFEKAGIPFFNNMVSEGGVFLNEETVLALGEPITEGRYDPQNYDNRGFEM